MRLRRALNGRHGTALYLRLANATPSDIYRVQHVSLQR
ncbi:hypothetical protein FHY13_002673 [Xanthomonas arboricola]|nr:hypothetical protein [Xanthomonas euroxanthea]